MLQQLAKLVARHALRDGDTATVVDHLRLSRRSLPSPAIHQSQGPTFGMVVQGQKRIDLGVDLKIYGPGHYVLVSLEVPVVSRVLQASPSRPLLGFGLDLTPEDLDDVFARIASPAQMLRPPPAGCIAVAHASRELMDASLRLLQLLDRPQDIPAMAALIRQEIIYRLLTGPCSAQLLQLARNNSPASRIAKAIQWLRGHYTAPLRIAELAAQVGMSESSLHHHFKTATQLSPLQYQKQLRLQHARRLIQVEQHDIGSAGYAAGYQSRSQFSREYRRMFGMSPTEHSHELMPTTRPDQRR